MRAAEDRLFELWRQTGEPAALAEVFDRTAGALFRIALHMSGDPHAAEDLVQTTYLAAIENARAWNEKRPFLPWLSGILANRARRANRRKAPPTPTARHDAGPVQAALASEVRDELEKAIDAAPEAYQPVLVLHLIYGHEPIEIAHALRRPPGTVRSQLSRGLELLRQRLPRGLALGVLAAALAPPSLAAVRRVVLAKAAASSVATLGGGVIAGGILMNKLLSGVAVAVAGVVLWAVWPPEANVVPPAARETAGAPQLQAAPADTVAGDRPAPQRQALADAEEPTTGSLLVRVRWGEDGTPAARVHVQVRPARSNTELFSRWHETDAGGNVQVALTPGHYHVRSDRGPRRQGPPFEVHAGREAVVDLTLPPGIDVNGIVVDDRERPIAGAQVWLSAGTHTDDGYEIAETGADGSFALRDVESGRFVTAMAKGHRVVAAHKLTTATGAEQVRIVLPGDGSVLEGRVFDADGKPCPDATVVFGTRGHHLAWSPEIADFFVPARQVRSDTHGRFTLLDVDGMPGRYPSLWVRAPGHTTWRGGGRERPPGPLEIHLQRGATLVGDVVDIAGQPVPELRVEVACASIEPGAGQAYQGPDWGRPVGYTGADGSLRIDNLPLGPFEVRAGDHQRGWANGSFVAHEGETLTWHGALRELTITGVVVDERNQPLAGWSVRAEPPHDYPQPDRATSGADGVFVLHGCENSTYTLTARQPDTPGARVGWYGCQLRSVATGATGVILRVIDNERPSAFVLGTLLGQDRTPQAGMHVCLDRAGHNIGPSLRTEDDGSFRVGPLPPGQYTLTAGAGENWLRRRLPTLGAGQDLDLGVMAFAQPGAAEVEVVDADGEPLDGLELRFVLAEPDEHWSPYGVSVEVDNGIAKATALQPGHYVVHFGGDLRQRLPQTRTTLQLRSGDTARLRLQLRRGVNQIERWLKPQRPVPFTFTYECRRDGNLVESFLQQDYRMVRDSEFPRCFAPGSYAVTITADDGNRSLTEFAIAATDPPDRVVEIRLP